MHDPKQWRSVAVPVELDKKLNATAKAEGRKKYALIQRALTLYLEVSEPTVDELRARAIAARQRLNDEAPK